MTLTAAELDELDALRRNATPGPYEIVKHASNGGYRIKAGRWGIILQVFCTTQKQRRDDIQYLQKLDPETVGKLIEMARGVK